jgi:hypothetical protein
LQEMAVRVRMCYLSTMKVWRLAFYSDAAEMTRISWHPHERAAFVRLNHLAPHLLDPGPVGTHHSIVQVTIPATKVEMLVWLNDHLNQENGNHQN